jgi:cysteine desulfurase / selenocysteine lyase
MPCGCSYHVAAILSYEAGIAVRSGSFCAQPYVRRLLGREDAGCDPGQLGLVRASFGLATTEDELETLVATLRAIATGDYDGLYVRDPARGCYQPLGWSESPPAFFQ